MSTTSHDVKRAKKNWGRDTNNKVIEFLKAQSLDGDTKYLEEILNKILSRKGKRKRTPYWGVRINDQLKSFAKLMLAQISIKETTDKLSELSDAIAMLDPASTDIKKELEALKEEKDTIHSKANKLLEEYGTLSSEIASFDKEIKHKGEYYFDGKHFSADKKEDMKRCASNSHAYIKQSQGFKSSYRKTVNAVDTSIAKLERQVKTVKELKEEELNEKRIIEVRIATHEINDLLDDKLKSCSTIRAIKELKLDMDSVVKGITAEDFNPSPNLKKEEENFIGAFNKAHDQIKEKIESIREIKSNILKAFNPNTKQKRGVLTLFTSKAARNKTTRRILNDLATDYLEELHPSKPKDITNNIDYAIKIMQGNEPTEEVNAVVVRRLNAIISGKKYKKDTYKLNPKIQRTIRKLLGKDPQAKIFIKNK